MKIRFHLLILLALCGCSHPKSLNEEELAVLLRGNSTEQQAENEEYFRPDRPNPLKGKIVEGRYYSPENIFSCMANNFGQGRYIAQDGIDDLFAAVAFYSPKADFNKVEVFNYPKMDKAFEKEDLRYIFDTLVQTILKETDDAQGVEILDEEYFEFEKYNALFIAISVKRLSYLRDEFGNFFQATRGHLIFKEGDKIVVMTHHITTPLQEIHTPLKHLPSLKKNILEFRNSFHLREEFKDSGFTKKFSVL